MSRWLLASLLPLLVSCALPAEKETPSPALETASSPIDMGEIDDVEVPSDESTIAATMPTGTFTTVEALCTAVVPHCEPVPEALDGVTVELRAPFLDVMPVQIETGDATAIHLLVRIAGGWVAIPHASMEVFHDDPGCFTIERDTGLVAVNVIGEDAPSLELVEKSERGAIMEDEDEGVWNDITERTVLCEVTADGFACEEPRLLSVARVRSPM